MSKSDTLTLSMAEVRKGPRWFYVTSKESGKVVYYSFSRKKVNWFIKMAIKETGCRVNFGDSIFCKVLEYDFRYSPKEYLIATIVLPFFALMAHYDSSFENFGNQYFNIVSIILALSALFMYKYISSKKSYSKALKSS